MKIFRLIILLLVVFLAGVGAVAVPPAPSFRHISTTDGLPSNCIRDIVQDSRGFIWFATDGGLVRYDGNRFKLFLPNSLPSDFKRDNYVTALVESRGCLWVGTDNGVLRYNPNYEQLDTIKCNYLGGCNKPINGNIKNLTADGKGRLWVGMARAGVYCVDTMMNVIHYDFKEISNNIGSVLVDSKDNVWVAGSIGASGIYLLEPGGDRFRLVNVKLDGGEVPFRSNSLAEDNMGHLWIGHWTEGLMSFDPVTGRARRVAVNSPDDFFHIHSITPSDDGTLLVGVDRGLIVYDIPTGEYVLYENDELRPSSLSGPFVYPIMKDREGGVWIGTYYAGVNYLGPHNRYFESFRHSRFVNSVSGNIISAFCEDRHGNIYIGSDDGGLCVLDKETGRYTHIPIDASSWHDNVHALCVDGDDIWIGTYGGGIKVYDTIKKRIKKGYYQADDDGLGPRLTSSYAIHRDSRGDLWASTMESIVRYDRDNDRFEEVRNLGVLTCDIDEDQSGNLWFSTQGNGVFKYHPSHGVWKNYRVGKTVGSLPDNHVAAIDIDGKGDLWVATANGVCRYNAGNDEFEPIDLGVDDISVFQLQACDNGLWIGTAGGLIHYNFKDRPTVFTQADGLVDDQFCINAAMRSRDGRLYVGTVNGYSSFVPALVENKGVEPTVIFTDLDVGGHAVSVGDRRLPAALSEITGLNLGPDDYSFSIGFAALSYESPSRNSYQYRLVGFDKNWIEADNDRRATYTNLPSGDYELQVRASNNDRLSYSAAISLPIHISPPWYGTWYMEVVWVVLVGLLVYLGIKVVIKRNEHRHRAEIARVNVAKEMELYEAKVNFFTTVAHEIRTPVSLIIGPLENIMQSGKKFTNQENDNLDIIYRNSQRLLFLVNQLLDFKKVEKLTQQTHYSRQEITSLVMSVAKRFKPSITGRGATFDIDIAREPFYADVDTEPLTKLVSNLLNNARKYTRSYIKLTCRVDIVGGTFSIAVSDDGTGISEEDKERIFQPFVQLDGTVREGGTGLGLSIVMRVVKAHKGEIHVDSEPGSGSTFTVILPLNQERLENEIVEQEESDTAVEGRSETPTVVETADTRPTMLVVDDNEDLLHFMTASFSDMYNVITVTGGEQALERLSCQAVDIIVSDWMMPGMSGVELCGKVRADMNTSHIPFVLLTAKTDNNSKIEGLNCGADAYIEKPFSVEYLKARLRNLAEMRQLLRRKFSQAPLEPIESIAPTRLDSKLLRQLTEIIEENFSNQDLSVEFLAQTMGLSRSGLYSKIKMLANVTPNELIQITRLKKAAQLLSENKYRINEICYMVGFNSPSYFAKCFQKQFGMKPGEFVPHS